MPNHANAQQLIRKLAHGIFLWVLILLLSMPKTVTAQTTRSQQPAAVAEITTSSTFEPDALLQYTSAGHGLGFSSTGVILSNGSYVYQITFEKTLGVSPLVEMEGRDNKADGLPPLGQATYTNLWPGITLSYDAPAGAILRSTYQLAPFADPAQISLHYNAPLDITADGRLAVQYENGTLYESAPIAWQVIDGQRLPVDVRFDHLKKQTLGFQLGKYNPALPLFIDPAIEWHTFWGGSGYDKAESLVMDGSGNLYVSGSSASGWGGSPVRAHNGDAANDTFVAKFDSSGTLLWHTFLGTTGYDSGRGLAIYGSTLYVTGNSVNTWGSPVRPHQNSGNKTNVFVAGLNSSTGALLWNTFLGGAGPDDSDRLSGADANGVVVAGESPSSWGSPVRSHSGDVDAFVARLDSSGNLVWNTFLGGGVVDKSYGSHLSGGAAYITGYSGSSWGSPVRAFSGGTYDGFVAKLDAATGALQWNTFLGGAGNNDSISIALSDGSNLYVSGISDITWGSPVRAFGGAYDTFVARLNPSDGSLGWHTFLGGTGYDWGQGLTLDGGVLYISGYSSDTWGTSPDPAHAGSNDMFVALLDPSNGALNSNGFYGSTGSEQVGRNAIAVSGNNIYLAGGANTTWGTPLHALSGSFDILLINVGPGSPDLTDTSLSNNTVSSSETNIGTLTPTGGTSPFTFTFQQSGAVCTAVNGADNASFTLSGNTLQRKAATPVGTYQVCIQVVDTNTESDQHAYTITVANPPQNLALSSTTVSDSQTDVGTFSHDNGTAPFTYTLETSGSVCNATNGADNASFSVSGTTLQRLGGTSAGSYAICAQVEDTNGLTTQKNFTITVSTSPSNITLSNNTVSDTRFIVGTLATVDGQPIFGYSLQNSGSTCNPTNGADNNLFEIEGNALKRKTTTTAGLYNVCIQSTDANTANFQKTFAVTVTFDGSAPPAWDMSLSSNLLIDGDGPGTLVGSMLATTEGVTYTLTDLAAFPLASNFNLSSDGLLTFTATANYNTQQHYPIRILGTAPDSSTRILDVVITVMKDGTSAGALAVEDAVQTNGPITIDVLTNDLLSTGATVWALHQIVKYPLHGTAQIGSVIYTPDAGYNGTDSVTYRACDDFDFCVTANVNITVSSGGSGSGNNSGSDTENDADAHPTTLPNTGFAAGVVTNIPSQPTNSRYKDYGDLSLEIPVLGVQTSIVGVPLTSNQWDLTWLDNQAGWLHGSAFPTWNGNSVITGHRVNSWGQEGVFWDLEKLAWGDTLKIHLNGQSYHYEVRQVLPHVQPSATNTLLKHQDMPWLTLVTCQGYDEKSNTYRWRYLVRAVLTKVE